MPPANTTIIIGAGLTGLSCAAHLATPSLVLEREAALGGTARSFARDGFTFDMTGHWLHLSHDGMRAFVERLMGDELVRLSRRAEVSSHGVRTPYPFQANTFGLPPDVIAECVLGYFAARERLLRREALAPTSFADFIEQRLGAGIARHFMVPYNTKLWTVPPAEMDAAWCERFVPQPSPEDVVQGALWRGGAGRALGYNTTFLYPRQGGIARLATRLRHTVAGEVRTGAAVRRVDWRARAVELDGGERLGYGALVSTMPLDDLVRALVSPPEAVSAAASRLRAAAVTYWDIGLPAANGADDAHWTYFPGADVPFYRVGAPSAVLPSLAPPRRRSLYVEASHARGTPPPCGEQAVLDGLRTVGLIARDEEPLLVARTTIDCAYVIMDHAFAAARATVLDWLSSQRILSVGRYGAWTYDSMEGALLAGKRAAEQAVEM